MTVETILINTVWDNRENSGARELFQRILPKFSVQGLGLQDFVIPVHMWVYPGREEKLFFVFCSAKRMEIVLGGASWYFLARES